MVQLLFSALLTFRSYWLSRAALRLEIIALRHQLAVVVLAGLIIAIELLRHDHWRERWILRVAFGIVSLLALKRALDCHRRLIVFVGGVRPEAHKFT